MKFSVKPFLKKTLFDPDLLFIRFLDTKQGTLFWNCLIKKGFDKERINLLQIKENHNRLKII